MVAYATITRADLRRASRKMSKPTDIRPIAASLYLLPIKTRVPLKFGPETTTEVTCARVRLTVSDARGRRAVGWGETPLSVHWVWPSTLTYETRHALLKRLCADLVAAWADFHTSGHPMEVGHAFQEQILPGVLAELNRTQGALAEPVPWLAALVCCSAFDLALHDAYGASLGLPVYQAYSDDFMNADLSHYLEAVEGSSAQFKGRYPRNDLVFPRPSALAAWHLVGGKDPIERSDLTGSEPDDGYPVLLRDWVRRDGLTCLKVKLKGDDSAWDLDRLLKVGQVAIEEGVHWLSADFNCTVADPAYVNDLLDRLLRDHPRLYGMILYVEQPFPYDLESHRIDVHSVSSRKPLFMDESAHDWKLIRLGRELGWSGVALKTCKTQTGALLSLSWAKAHGMTLMVQDLSNPMLAQIPHVLLAAHAGTIMGVESNGMQFYPDASLPEAAVHPGLYRRSEGQVDLSTIEGPGFGYRLNQIARALPCPFAEAG
jgi:L-alanine-DL-glutamate epimerase-like enolase superfamily enzyme